MQGGIGDVKGGKIKNNLEKAPYDFSFRYTIKGRGETKKGKN